MAKAATESMQAVERRRASRIGVALLCCYAYFFYLGGNWNVESRGAQIFALAEHGTLVIDGYPFLPPGGGDAAWYRGHYYSDKLVGPSLIAVPFYRAMREIAALVEMPFRQSVYLSLRFTNLLTNAVPSALLGGLLYLFLAELGIASGLRAWLALAYGAGTLALPYSTALFGHQLAAVSAAGAFMLLWRQRRGWSQARAVAAGALAGFAAISDVMGLFIAIIFGLYATWLSSRQDGERKPSIGLVASRVAPFAALALGVFAIQLVANWRSFGNPLAFPHLYHAQAAFRARHTAGLFGIHLPKLYPTYQLTVGPWRGLFYGSPVLLLAIPGFFLLARRWRAEALTIVSGSLAVVLINAGYENWTTGSAYGPRYQIVVLPLLIIAAAPAAQRWPLIFRTLAAVSVGFMVVVTAQTPFVPEDLRNPLATALEQFAAGRLLNGNLGMVFGLQGAASLIPLAVLETSVLVALGMARERSPR